MSVLAKLCDGRVFSVGHSNGTFTFQDACDGAFEVNLTPQEVLRLADELRAMVKTPELAPGVEYPQ